MVATAVDEIWLKRGSALGRYRPWIKIVVRALRAAWVILDRGRVGLIDAGESVPAVCSNTICQAVVDGFLGNL